MISTTEDYCHLRFMMVIIVEFVDSILGRIEMTHNYMIGSTCRSSIAHVPCQILIFDSIDHKQMTLLDLHPHHRTSSPHKV